MLEILPKMLSPKREKEELKKHKVTLIGGSLEEAPMMYKDINQGDECSTRFGRYSRNFSTENRENG